MLGELKESFDRLLKESESLSTHEFKVGSHLSDDIRSFLERRVCQLPEKHRHRLMKEFFEYGPLSELFSDEKITEILINSPTDIWFEKNGCLEKYADEFLNGISYNNIFERIMNHAGLVISLENPIVDGSWGQFRISAVKECLTGNYAQMSLRRHPFVPWTFDKLIETNWCTRDEKRILQNLINKRKNFLIIGGTSSGKTSLINAIMAEISQNERMIVIEDSSEIHLQNTVSTKLLTRTESIGQTKEISQAHLVKAALRLRPDRIVMGEIRSHEAKDFLMAVATGHNGCFGSLHAQDPHQALIRLEMLIQMGAPQWNLSAIRKLIRLSLDAILITERDMEGNRRFKGGFKICSLEESGFLLEPLTHMD